jgi:DNA-binding transcriptional MerR regulator
MDKAPGAFRTISEVADEIDVPQHVLRFWESRFTQIRPMKRGGGRRFYRPEDVDLLRGVRHLLYGEGYTIRGVQRILREQGAAFVQAIWRTGAELPPPSDEDREEDDIAATSAAGRSEPDLSAFAVPVSRIAESAGQDRPAERRAPMMSAGSAAAPAPAPAKPAGIGGDERRKLRAALDDLVACNRLLQAALAGPDAAQSGATSDAPA